jgi:hypothetical protein
MSRQSSAARGAYSLPNCLSGLLAPAHEILKANADVLNGVIQWRGRTAAQLSNLHRLRVEIAAARLLYLSDSLSHADHSSPVACGSTSLTHLKALMLKPTSTGRSAGIPSSRMPGLVTISSVPSRLVAAV